MRHLSFLHLLEVRLQTLLVELGLLVAESACGRVRRDSILKVQLLSHLGVLPASEMFSLVLIIVPIFFDFDTAAQFVRLLYSLRQCCHLIRILLLLFNSRVACWATGLERH